MICRVAPAAVPARYGSGAGEARYTVCTPGWAHTHTGWGSAARPPPPVAAPALRAYALLPAATPRVRAVRVRKTVMPVSVAERATAQTTAGVESLGGLCRAKRPSCGGSPR